MILLLDTSSPICRLTLVADGQTYTYDEWEAGRELAKGLMGHLEKKLEQRGKSFSDISGIGVFEGPGSFTGLRIGMAVLNTVADALDVPIVGARGADWQAAALTKLEGGENERIVLPHYGSEAHITRPRK